MFEFHTDRKAYHQLLHKNARDYVIPFIQSGFPLTAGHRVLEIGSGDGGNLSAFLEIGCKAVGVELDEHLVAFTQQQLPTYIANGQLVMMAKDIYDADIERDLGGLFDVVVLKDVIEHIHDQPKLFSRMKDMLRPNGVIFFGFPPWQMPFGGHQQICTGKWTSKMPWYHLLPRSWYKAILAANKENVEVLMEIRETGLSIETFERFTQQSGCKVIQRKLWLINPVYQQKFGWKPRRQLQLIAAIPVLRNFFTTCAYYLIQPNK